MAERFRDIVDDTRPPDKPDPIFAAGMAALAEAFDKGWNAAMENAATVVRTEECRFLYQGENPREVFSDAIRKLMRPAAQQHTGEGR